MYKIFTIKSPVSPPHLASYKALRLTSLQRDPHCFGSNYAREAAFTEDDWRMRLDSPSKRTFIASVHDKDKSHEPELGGHKEDGGEWVGTVAIVGPSDLPPSLLVPFKEADVGENWAIYGLYAMWVHPDHRGKGVGGNLLKACLEWERTDINMKSLEESRGRDLQKVVILLVYNDNTAGRGLSTRTGFVNLEEVPSKEGEKWMCLKVTESKENFNFAD